MDHLNASIVPSKDDTERKITECFDIKKATHQPGDFKSDAQFFVFTGVIAWLGSTACLAYYVFFSQRYLDDDKKAPMIVSIIVSSHALFCKYVLWILYKS